MPNTNDYEVDEIALFVGGERIASLDAVGWDSSRDHEHDESLGDDPNTWILSTEDPEVTFAVKSTSPSIERIDTAYQDGETIDMTVKYPPTDARDQSQFYEGKIQSFAPADDWEEDTMPMHEGSAAFDKVDHEYA